MKRAFGLFFLICFYGTALLAGQVVDAQPNAFQVVQVEQLPFVPMQANGDLEIARDSAGQTWVRGHIPADLRNIPISFQIPSSRIRDYELYTRQEGHWMHVTRNTDGLQGHFRSRFPQYALTPSDSVYYLALSEHPPQTLQVLLKERQQFASDEMFQLFRIGLYYGLALMSVIFNLVFFLIFRDKRFITYCVLLLSTFLSFFYEDGMFHYFSNGRWVNDYLSVLNSALSSIASLPFTYYFLDLNVPFRRFRKWFLGISALLLAGVLIYALTDNGAAQIFVYATCFLFPIWSLYLAARRFRQDVYARFLLLSFSFVVLIGLLYVLYTRVDSAAYALFNIDTFRLVSAVEIIAISFAIIFKAKGLQRENDRYREELNNYLKLLEIKAADQQPKNGQALNVSTAVSRDELANELKKQYDLTEREIDVLLCIWEGLTNKEIADRLCITLSTTKYHTGNLYVKLDVKNRNQALVLGKVLQTTDERLQEQS